ncbi:hypothetical protein D3C85_940310 [compost metagenome]
MADALVGREVAVELRQGGQEVGLHPRTGLLAGSRAQLDQRQGLVEAAAHEAHLLNPMALGDLAFDGGGRHVLALAGLEDVLHPAGDAQVALGIDHALVAGVQPAVTQGFRALVRLEVIAGHQRRAAVKDLAVLGNSHFVVRHHPANRAEAHLPRPVEVAVGEVLGHAVALADGQANAPVPLQQRHRDGRGAAHQHPCAVQAKAPAHSSRHQGAQ